MIIPKGNPGMKQTQRADGALTSRLGQGDIEF